MIDKIITKEDGFNRISYDLSKLTPDELDFAEYMCSRGWNSFMKILPNITPNELLIDGGFPYNREYTDDKEPLVTYYNKALRGVRELNKK